jgi:hypothetical protein
MGARELRRLRGGLCVRMTVVQREIPEYKPQALPEVLLDRLDDRIRVPAMGAFIIPKLDQRASGVFIPLDMIRGVYRHFESAHETLLFRQLVQGLKNPVGAGVHRNRG